MTGAPGWFLFDGLVKHDLETGAEQRYAFGDGVFGSETPFAPRPGATGGGRRLPRHVHHRHRPRLLGVPRLRRAPTSPSARSPGCACPSASPPAPTACWAPAGDRVGSLMPIEVHLFLPQMRMSLDVLVVQGAGRRGGRLRRRRAHGPPRPAAGRRPADVGRDGHRHLAGRPHDARHHRPPRAVRRLPPPGRARPRGRHRSTTPRAAASSSASAGARSRPSWPRSASAPPSPRDRVERLGETLAVVRALWTGEPVDFDGRFHQLRGAQQRPTPLGRIPIVIGGAGPKTLALVRRARGLVEPPRRQGRTGSTSSGRRSATPRRLDPADGDLRARPRHPRRGPRAGRTAGSGTCPAASPATARRWSPTSADLEARGIERAYLWFSDFADEATLTRFGEEVLPQLG